MAEVKIYLTTGTTWLVPSDWNPANNSVRCLGAGGIVASDGFDFYGGGGGAFAIKHNLNISGTIPIFIPITGSDGNTDFNSGEVEAESGRIGYDGLIIGTGGQAANCNPSANAKSGGQGGLFFDGSGGGAAGEDADGADAGLTGEGGNGNGGLNGGGNGGAQTVNGSNGTNFGNSKGSGGGAGGGANAGQYGAGGGVTAGQGLIVITYEPLNNTKGFFAVL